MIPKMVFPYFRGVVVICLLAAPVIVYQMYPAAVSILTGDIEKATTKPVHRNPSLIRKPQSRFEAKHKTQSYAGRKATKSLIAWLIDEFPMRAVFETALYVFIVNLFLRKICSKTIKNEIITRGDQQESLQKAYKKAARNRGAELKCVKQLLAMYRDSIHKQECNCKDAFIIGLLENKPDSAENCGEAVALQETERKLMMKDVKKRDRKIDDQANKLRFIENSMESLRKDLALCLAPENECHSTKTLTGDVKNNSGSNIPRDFDSFNSNTLDYFKEKLDKILEKAKQWNIEDVEVYDGDSDDSNLSDVSDGSNVWPQEVKQDS